MCMHSSHIHFSTLNIRYDHQTGMKLAGIVELCTIPLSVYFRIMFYESLNVQNRMCELCTFSQIRLHIYPRIP